MLKTDLKETSETIKQIPPHARSTKDCRKKRLLRIVLACFLLLLLLSSAVSCNADLAPVQTLGEAPTKEVKTEAEPNPLAKPYRVYRCDDGSVLSSYRQKRAEDLEKVAKGFEKEGYTLYSESEIGGNLAKTYVKDSALAHLYYHPTGKELNVVLSSSAADTLPPSKPEKTDGDVPCTVTQLNQSSTNYNGMGYVIQLKDGSFIIYDGGFLDRADELLDTLSDLAGGEKPLVRAWVLTHLHNDHYEAFLAVSGKENLRDLLTVEHIIYSPLPLENPGNDRDDTRWRIELFDKIAPRFEGAKVVYAHTGMKFTFCNLEMEILYTPESLYKNLFSPEGFNNSSILSRLRDENGSILFTGDIAALGSNLSVRLYGDSLASDMVQMSHHGVESCPLAFYEKVQANTLWYPCSYSLYASDRNKALRDAVAAFPTTKEILIAGNGRATRPFPKN